MRVRFAVLVVLAALCAVVVAQPEYGPACNIVNDCADVADDFPSVFYWGWEGRGCLMKLT